MRTLAILAALCCTQAHAYLGGFDPQPLRNSATITVIDTQVPGAVCLAYGASEPLNVVLSPILVQSVECAIYDQALLAVPLTFGPGQLYGLHVLGTPNALLGHGFRHLFDGHFHPPLLSFVERVRHPDQAAGALVPGPERGGDVQAPEGGGPERGDQRSGVRAEERTADAGITRCTFFTEARNLAYEPLGALVRECIR